MMISSVFTKHRDEDRKYPYFGKSKELGFIVLFRTYGSGTVLFLDPGKAIDSRRTIYEIGHYSEDWVEQNFEPVRGILSIEAN